MGKRNNIWCNKTSTTACFEVTTMETLSSNNLLQFRIPDEDLPAAFGSKTQLIRGQCSWK
jgi:hypothetical protein